MRGASVHAHRTESLLDELEAMQRRVADRAFQIFRERGAKIGGALDDWLSAERQTVWKPAIEIVERDKWLFVEVAAPGVEARQLEIQATPETILIKANVDHRHAPDNGAVHVCEFQAGHLFRLVQLPVKINPDTVKAEYQNGLIRLSAAIAGEAQIRKVEVNAA